MITPSTYGNLGLAGLAETPAEAAVGRALDAIRPAAGVRTSSDLAGLFYPLYVLPGSAVAAALGQLSPAISGDALLTARDGWYQMADSVSDQIAARRGGVTEAATATSPHGLTIWVNGLGAFSRVASSDAPSFSGTIGGGAVGADKVVAPGVIAGFAIGGVSTTTVSGDGSRASGEAGQLTIYGGWQKGIAFADGQAVYGIGNQYLRRNLSMWGTSIQGGTSFSDAGAQVHAGLHLLTGGLVVEPLAGLSVLTLSDSELTETAGGALAEHIAGASMTSVRSLLGVRVGHTFTLPSGGRLTAHALVGWDHEFGDTSVGQYASFGTGGGSFPVPVASESRDRARIGGGISIALNDRVALFGGYDASVAATGTVQQLTGGVRVSW